MKAALLFLLWLATAAGTVALAQVPQGTHVGNKPSMNFYRDTPQGKKLDFIITGESGRDAGPSKVLISQFELRSFRDGDPKAVQIIAQAPQCVMDVQNSSTSDPGPLQIFTPATNLFVEGAGFLFTQSNHFLILSNNVHTRVVKSLLRSSPLGPVRTNAAPATNQYLNIFAHRGFFNLDSNLVDYAGAVHAIDPQLDLTCDFLTIHFTTNGTVESIVARQNVVLTTTNNGVATGDIGYYYVTNGSEMMRLVTNAFWRNGDEQARANEFLYDSTKHVLAGSGHVRAQWPNLAKATNAPKSPGQTSSFRFLYADFATLQFPPTNGPVQSMRASGNVIIVNQADQSRATAEQADYDRKTDRVDLTGNPVWWNDTMEVRGETLAADLAGKTYHARTAARFKMRMGGGAKPARATNQWLFISSDDIEYQTNRAVFYRNVKGRLVQNDRLKDALNCDLLTVNLANNEAESGFASGRVYGETAPDKSGLVKTITCAELDAWRNVKTGFMKTIVARTNVDIVEKRSGKDAVWNELTAGLVTAQFSPVTNQIQQTVAEPNVVIDQLKSGHKIHASGQRAVYAAGTDAQVKLTGQPFAQKDNYIITNADFLIWHPGANSFNASGLFQMIPVKPAAPKKP